MESRATNDPGVEGLIARFTRHRADVIAALANEQDASGLVGDRARRSLRP